MKIAQGALLYGDDYSAAQLQPNLPTRRKRSQGPLLLQRNASSNFGPPPEFFTEGNEGNEGGSGLRKIQSLFSSLSSV